MKALYGTVHQIRDYPSLGVTRITIEVPHEFHVQATAEFHNGKVLLTKAPESLKDVPYGVLDAESDHNARAESGLKRGVAPGPLCMLAVQWCQEARFQDWLQQEFEDLWEACSGGAVPLEEVAKAVVCRVCGIVTRKQLDEVEQAAQFFHDRIRVPYMQHCGVFTS